MRSAFSWFSLHPKNKRLLRFFKLYDFNQIIAFVMSSDSDNAIRRKSDETKAPKRSLAAFDFDYTVVSKNTDTVVRDLLPPSKFPEQSIVDTQGWTQYMATVFQLLHENRISAAKIKDTICEIPEVPGFVRLMKCLHKQHNFDLIIISDSNEVFIKEWLQAHGLTDYITGIFTNHAHFDESGLLTIKAYHHQTDCQLSAPNLCKGKVLEHFVVEQDLRHNKRYERIVYVGDGHNDICPILRLRSTDFACARLDFALDKAIKKNRDKMKLHAELFVWKNGFDLLEQIENALEHKAVRN